MWTPHNRLALCYAAAMATSPIVSLLSGRPQDELEALKKKMQTERQKLADEAARLEVELQQVEDALARQARRQSSSKAASAGSTPVWQLVLDFLRQHQGPATPADVNAALRAQGYKGSDSAIYNSFKRLVDMHEILRMGDGIYEAPTPQPSDNGAVKEQPAEATNLGPGGQPGTTSGEPAGTPGTNRP